jgi:subtilisin family serine protease
MARTKLSGVMLLVGWLVILSLRFTSPAAGADPIKQPSDPIKIVIELRDEPAAIVYAAARQLRLPERLSAPVTRARMARIEAAQQQVMSALQALNATILYRTQRVYNGIAAIVPAAEVETIRQLPGVKAVHPLIGKSLDNWHSVPLIGAPHLWEGAGSIGLTGAGIKIGIIDSGIDYLHADFGGPASTAAYHANATTVITDTFNGQPLFPTAKVVGGWDFVGDDYTGTSGTPAIPSTSILQPDPDPAPCNSNKNTSKHGTHVAGTAAGFGVNADGSTYTGAYTSSLKFDQFKIGPGVAPRALLYSLRVFGCTGASDVADAAIEWAVDPDQDGDFSDHLDVINLSLGAPYGAEEDSTAIAANNAALAGVIVVAAAGNNGDGYFSVNTPSTAARAISVAGSDDGAMAFDGFRVITPATIADVYPAAQSIDYDWLTTTLPITGQLVYPEAGADPVLDQRSGCYAFSITNTQRISGNIALLNWTEPSCGGTAARAANAVAAGAHGVIFADFHDTFQLIIAGSPIVPAYSVPKDVGDLLKTTLTFSDVYVVMTGEYHDRLKRLELNGQDAIYAGSARGPRRGDSLLKPDITAPAVTVHSALSYSGDQGYSLSGTSMAAPHIAGAMALLRQLHPDWSVAELKALIMNTASTDITLGALKYDPGRVGAGRVTLPNVAASPVVAYDASVPHLVSVSFGALEVTDTLTLTRTIHVVNKSARPLDYSIDYASYANVPGVSYTLVPTAILLLPNSATDISLTLRADAQAMKHSRAPTVSDAGGRAWLSEASGYVVLTPSFRHTIFLPIIMNGGGIPAPTPSSSTQIALALRVPVYAAPRPASVMQAAPVTLDFTTITTTSLVLSGQGLNTGTNYPTDTLSLVSAFELAEISPVTATQHPAADLRYLGAGNNFGAAGLVTGTTLFFAVTTDGNWSVPLAPEAQFKIFIDADRNGADDFVLSHGTLNGQAADVFYSRLADVSGNPISYPLPVNYFPASVYDTVLFNSNGMILAVPANALGLTEANPRFNYRVETYASGLKIDASVVHTYTAAAAGLDFSGGLSGAPTWPDLPNATIPIEFNAGAYAANGSSGALLLHHHNAMIDRGQVITINP